MLFLPSPPKPDHKPYYYMRFDSIIKSCFLCVWFIPSTRRRQYMPRFGREVVVNRFASSHMMAKLALTKRVAHKSIWYIIRSYRRRNKWNVHRQLYNQIKYAKQKIPTIDYYDFEYTWWCDGQYVGNDRGTHSWCWYVVLRLIFINGMWWEVRQMGGLKSVVVYCGAWLGVVWVC